MLFNILIHNLSGLYNYLHLSLLKSTTILWRETLAVGRIGEFTVKAHLVKENLANFVHAQPKTLRAWQCYPA